MKKLILLLPLTLCFIPVLAQFPIPGSKVKKIIVGTYVTENKYNTSGKLSEQTMYTSNGTVLEGKIVYTYNPQNKVIGLVHTNAKGENTYNVQITYNSLGQMTDSVADIAPSPSSVKPGWRKENMVFTYDQNGKCISKTLYVRGEFASKTEYTYSGSQIATMKYRNGSNFGDDFTYTYSNGKCTQICHKWIGNGERYNTRQFELYPNGFLKSVIAYGSTKGMCSIDSPIPSWEERHFEYDTSNRLIKVTLVEAFGATTITEYVY